MRKIGSYQAKTHLPRLLDKVAKGERIVITKHGVPVAMLVPVDERPKRDPKRVIEAIKIFSRRHGSKGLPTREMIEEGRRY